MSSPLPPLVQTPHSNGAVSASFFTEDEEDSEEETSPHAKEVMVALSRSKTKDTNLPLLVPSLGKVEMQREGDESFLASEAEEEENEGESRGRERRRMLRRRGRAKDASFEALVQAEMRRLKARLESRAEPREGSAMLASTEPGSRPDLGTGEGEDEPPEGRGARHLSELGRRSPVPGRTPSTSRVLPLAVSTGRGHRAPPLGTPSDPSPSSLSAPFLPPVTAKRLPVISPRLENGSKAFGRGLASLYASPADKEQQAAKRRAQRDYARALEEQILTSPQTRKHHQHYQRRSEPASRRDAGLRGPSTEKERPATEAVEGRLQQHHRRHGGILRMHEGPQAEEVTRKLRQQRREYAQALDAQLQEKRRQLEAAGMLVISPQTARRFLREGVDHGIGEGEEEGEDKDALGMEEEMEEALGRLSLSSTARRPPGTGKGETKGRAQGDTATPPLPASGSRWWMDVEGDAGARLDSRREARTASEKKARYAAALREQILEKEGRRQQAVEARRREEGMGKRRAQARKVEQEEEDGPCQGSRGEASTPGTPAVPGSPSRMSRTRQRLVRDVYGRQTSPWGKEASSEHTPSATGRNSHDGPDVRFRRDKLSVTPDVSAASKPAGETADKGLVSPRSPGSTPLAPSPGPWPSHSTRESPALAVAGAPRPSFARHGALATSPSLIERLGERQAAALAQRRILEAQIEEKRSLQKALAAEQAAEEKRLEEQMQRARDLEAAVGQTSAVGRAKAQAGGNTRKEKDETGPQSMASSVLRGEEASTVAGSGPVAFSGVAFDALSPLSQGGEMTAREEAREVEPVREDGEARKMKKDESESERGALPRSEREGEAGRGEGDGKEEMLSEEGSLDTDSILVAVPKPPSRVENKKGVGAKERASRDSSRVEKDRAPECEVMPSKVLCTPPERLRSSPISVLRPGGRGGARRPEQQAHHVLGQAAVRASVYRGRGGWQDAAGGDGEDNEFIERAGPGLEGSLASESTLVYLSPEEERRIFEQHRREKEYWRRRFQKEEAPREVSHEGDGDVSVNEVLKGSDRRSESRSSFEIHRSRKRASAPTLSPVTQLLVEEVDEVVAASLEGGEPFNGLNTAREVQFHAVGNRREEESLAGTIGGKAGNSIGSVAEGLEAAWVNTEGGFSCGQNGRLAGDREAEGREDGAALRDISNIEHDGLIDAVIRKGP